MGCHGCGSSPGAEACQIEDVRGHGSFGKAMSSKRKEVLAGCIKVVCVELTAYLDRVHWAF
jgi:hypothetical protein